MTSRRSRLSRMMLRTRSRVAWAFFGFSLAGITGLIAACATTAREAGQVGAPAPVDVSARQAGADLAATESVAAARAPRARVLRRITNIELEMPARDNNRRHQRHIAVQTAIYLGDLNRDGDPDFFVLPNRTAHRSRLFVSSPTGHRPTPREYGYGYYGKAVSLDDDGDPEMFIKGGQARERRLEVYLLDHDTPGLAPDARLQLWQRLTGNESFDLHDVTGDRIPDLIVVHHLAERDASGVPFNVSWYRGTGSTTLDEVPFVFQESFFLAEFGGQRAIRWGAIMAPPAAEEGDPDEGPEASPQAPRLYLTGAEGMPHRLGYLEWDPATRLFDRTFIPLEAQGYNGITVRVGRSVVLFSTRTGVRAYDRIGRLRHDLAYCTERGAVDFFEITDASGRQVFGEVQRQGRRRIRIYRRGVDGEFRVIGGIQVPRKPRYVSFFHNERGAVNHHAPNRILLAHENGATVYELDLTAGGEGSDPGARPCLTGG